MSRTKTARLDQADIIRLGTRKPSFSTKQQILLNLSEHDGISTNQLARNLGKICPDSSFPRNILSLIHESLIKREKCSCGQGNILYITSKGRKHARSLKK